VVPQRIIPGGHGSLDAGLEIPQPTQRTDDPATDLLEHGSNVGVGRRLTCEKAWGAPLVGTIEVDALQEKQVIVHIEIEGTAKALDTRDRSCMHLAPRDPARDGLVDVIVRDGPADNGMDCGGQVR
jgi:hypothetical protein